jgi:hypothetical protein
MGGWRLLNTCMIAAELGHWWTNALEIGNLDDHCGAWPLVDACSNSLEIED